MAAELAFPAASADAARRLTLAQARLFARQQEQAVRATAAREDRAVRELRALLRDLLDFATARIAVSTDYRQVALTQLRTELEAKLTALEQAGVLSIVAAQRDVWRTGTKAIGDGLEQAGVLGRLLQPSEDQLAALTAYSTVMIASMADTARSRLLPLVQQTATGLLTPIEAMARLGRTLDRGAFRSVALRAEAIIRTEVGRSYSVATQVAQEQAVAAGAPLRKRWLAAGDARTRPSHRSANGQTVAIDKPFRVGGARLMYPRDPRGPARETVQCRCVVVSVLAAAPTAAPAAVKPLAPRARPVKPTPKTWLDRVRAAVPDAGVKTESAAIRVGRLVLEEIDRRDTRELEPLRRQLAGIRHRHQQDADLLMSEQVRAVDRPALYLRLAETRRDMDGLERRMSDARVQINRSVAAELRLVGLEATVNLDPGLHMRPDLSQKAMTTVGAASKLFPHDWVAHGNTRGVLYVNASGNRGSYTHGAERAYLILGFSSGEETAIHELAHRYAHVLPDIASIEAAFYLRRTQGEVSGALGAGIPPEEVGRKDKFVHPYIGRDYGSGAYEVVSMGYEILFAHRYKELARKDDEYDALLWGIFAGVRVRQ